MILESDFQQQVVAFAVSFLSKREIFLLSLMQKGTELAQDGLSVWVGKEKTSARTVNRLLLCCAISQDSCSPTYWHINETGKKILHARIVEEQG